MVLSINFLLSKVREGDHKLSEVTLVVRRVAHIVTWECASAHVKSNMQAKESTIIWYGKVSETKSRHIQAMQNSKAMQNLELGALPSDLPNINSLEMCLHVA